jgi:hypothetical protein
LAALAALATFALGGCFDVDAESMPQNQAQPNLGLSSPRVRPADYAPIRQPGSEAVIAAFRTSCQISHTSYADPIVMPGGYVNHLHSFYGNTRVGKFSTADSIRVTGNSTCDGGTANRTAYWAPSMLDVTGEPPYQVVSHTTRPCNATERSTQCGQDRDNALQIYYKSGYDGVRAEDIVNFPKRLRMVAGRATATAPQSGSGTPGDDIVQWHCAVGPGSDAGVTELGYVMPQCPAGQLLVMSIQFPQCWDGINLDSPDHKSHMAYGQGYPFRGCPATHPKAFAQITQNFRWRVPTTGMDSWRLSSDLDLTKPAGMTAHADWMNGWDTAVFKTIIDNCFHVPSTEPRDCRMNLLGDGRMLTRYLS